MKMAGMLAGVLLGGMTAAVWAQTSQTQPPDCAPGQDSTVEKPCTPVSAVERFPFPGANAPAASVPAVNAPSGAGGGTPDAPAPAGKSEAGASAAKRFPFPGDANAGSSSSSSGSSDSSSSSSSDSSPSSSDSSSSASDRGGDAGGAPKLKDAGSEGVRAGFVKVQTKDQKVNEDLQVGNFYRNDGNYAGAYLRAKDAFALMPDDEEVNLLYAEVAMKLGKKDEALEHYQTYLQLDPKAKKADEAEQAIQELTSSKKK